MKHKERIEKLRQEIETISRLDSKRNEKKQKELSQEVIRDMNFRCGMKKALAIIEGKDDDE